MRGHIRFIVMAGLLIGASLMAEPRKQNPQTREKQGAVHQFNVKLGEEFKIKNVSGTEVAVSIVNKAGAYYIRSSYHHGWTSEIRHYAISNNVAFAAANGSAISIFFPHRPEAKLAGAVYVINNHGEAVKVDDITMVDLTW